ncbi:hypothetical protein BDW42DRAFT_194898 [Aspergillus taichungensis]|uniref:HNH nuclease domain-containing protein n=1 Tax=Aspergillus taichungensis TaxID=482145 RepID=A0A2J5HRI2_9EURO|nr:hypothetical protein BDW42DRAFT_194898 [Aspergillus taichungensis]
MEVAPELQDPRRLALMERLHNAVKGKKIDSSTWAVLWFSDITKLDNMVRRAESGGSDDLGGVMGKISSVAETTGVIRKWSTNARPPVEESPKKRSSDEMATPRAPSPSKIPRRYKDKQSLDSGKANLSPALISPTKEQKLLPKMPRSRSARKSCMERDEERCVITKAGEPLEVAHIYPYCLGQREEDPSQFFFWSGDEITLQTDNPEIRPLPSVELLAMQWMLNRVKAISGAADISEDELNPYQCFLSGRITEDGMLDEDPSDDELLEAESVR